MKKELNADFLIENLNMSNQDTDKFSSVSSQVNDPGLLNFIDSLNQKNSEEVEKFQDAIKSN